MEVVDVNESNPNHYVLKDCDNIVKTYHVQWLKAYKKGDYTPTARSVALKDKQKFDVEYVLAHYGNPKRKTAMQFEVKWVGYPTTTLETWGNLCDNKALHDYLKKRNLQKLIPQKFL